jgi:DNA invertase Pin-like site-specific DNA recombinase
MTSKQLRAAIYARISDDRLGDELGVKRQHKDARKAVEARGGTVVLPAKDDDISALHGAQRPGYDEVMRAAEDGRITHIVATEQSRLWRNRRERAEGIERLARAKVGIILVRGSDIDMTSAQGRAMAGLLGEFDTMESEIKSERVRAKVAELVATGAIGNGGPRPFGYRRIYSGEGPRRKILRDQLEPKEADIVRELAERFLNGESLRSLAGDLNRRGVKTSTGGKWSMQGLRWMLRSGRIAGLREHHGEIVDGVKAVWPAIIDKRTHKRIRTKLDNGQRPPGSRVRIHYLAGFVRCGKCDSVMRVGIQHGTLKFKCPPKQEGGCNGRVVELAPLRDFIDAYMVGRMSDPETLRELAQREVSMTVDTAELLESIEADERRLELLRSELLTENVPEVAGAIREVRRGIAETRAKLAEATQTPELRRLDLPDLAQRWQSLHIDRKRTLLRLFVDSIVIGPGVPGRRWFDNGRVAVNPA